MPEASRLPRGSQTAKRKLRVDVAHNPDGLHNLTDEELYARHVDGCKRSFTILFQRHNERIVRRLMHRFRFTHSTAEEVAQEVWCRINHGSYRVIDTFQRMTLAICREESMTAIARCNRRSALFVKDCGQEITEEVGVTFDDVAVAAEQNAAIRQAYESLPADLRRPIKLVFFMGLSISETSKKLAIPARTIGDRLEKAKAMLKSALT